MSSGQPNVTTTSYAILGLLAIKPWTTHELVQQVDRSLRRIWPRAQSKLYEEPKKLVALGLAKATDDPVGRRRRTRYTITPRGRRALAAWLEQPGAGPVLECEQLLQVHFADSTSKEQVLATLAAMQEWVQEHNEENVVTGRAYASGAGQFPQRSAINMLGGRFIVDFYSMVADWAEWATAIVEEWPEDPGQAVADHAEQVGSLRRAERLAARGGQTVPQR